MGPLRLISYHFSKSSRTLCKDSIFKPLSTLKPLIHSFSTSTEEQIAPNTSQEVAKIVEELSGLTLLEISDLTDVLRNKLALKEMPLMMVMMPGMGFSGVMEKGKGGGGTASEKEGKKAEKTAFDVKIEAFDAAAKIKVIKEVRACTDLGLKEAKELVERVPTLLVKGVGKEEAEKIIEKMKGVGAKAVME